MDERHSFFVVTDLKVQLVRIEFLHIWDFLLVSSLFSSYFTATEALINLEKMQGQQKFSAFHNV